MVAARVMCALIVAVACLPTAAWAQTCPGDSTETVTGTIAVSGQTVPIDINLAPCQTVLFNVSTTGNTTYGASVTFSAWTQESTPRQLFSYGWASYGTVVKNGLPTGGIGKPWVPPYRGTRGVEGLIGQAKIYASFLNGLNLSYSITIMKVARPGYNVGGTSFANATLVPLNLPNKGSLHNWEPGQYYRIHLEPQQTIYISGSAMASSQYGANLYVELYDANQVFVKNLINAEAVYGTKMFPTTASPPSHTHTGASGADYYLRMWSRWYPMHDFQLTVEAPMLKLFLDADWPRNFDPNAAPPEDDSSTYVPGAYQHDDLLAFPPQLAGESRPLPTSTTPIETIEVIAAYVDSTGKIVNPPSGGSVVFTMFDPDDPNQTSTVSSFLGVANNWSDPRGDVPSLPDFVFAGASTASFVNKTARISLNVWDYGGFLKIFARHGVGSTAATASMRMPRDANANWLPDAGWKVIGHAPVADPGGVDVADDDDDVIVQETSNRGDGLTRFEEFRGFVTTGTHVRTDPGAADLFVNSNLAEGVGFATALAIEVREIDGPEMAINRSINYLYENTGPAGTPPGHYINPLNNVPDQLALSVIDAGYDPLKPNTAGETELIRPGPYKPSNVIPIKIFTQQIRLTSPTTNDLTTPNDVDPEKFSQTIAHEIGHGVNFAHIDVNQDCDWQRPGPPIWTVMVTNYFTQSAVMNCAWSNIPHIYNPAADYPPFTLK